MNDEKLQEIEALDATPITETIEEFSDEPVYQVQLEDDDDLDPDDEEDEDDSDDEEEED